MTKKASIFLQKMAAFRTKKSSQFNPIFEGDQTLLSIFLADVASLFDIFIFSYWIQK